MAAQAFRRLTYRWWPVIVLVALGAVAGLGYALLRQPVYAAKAYVAAVAQNTGDSSATSFAQAYARIAGQGDVLEAAVRNGTGQISVQDLQRAVRASSSPDAPVIEITGSGSTARGAADLSNLVATGLISTANQRSTDTRIRLVLLSPAVPPTAPVSPSPALDTAVGAAAGLLLGGLALLVRPGPTRSAGTGFVPADDTPMREIRRWTGTARVIVPNARSRSDRRRAGSHDGEDGTLGGDNALAKTDGWNRRGGSTRGG